MVQQIPVRPQTSPTAARRWGFVLLLLVVVLVSGCGGSWQGKEYAPEGEIRASLDSLDLDSFLALPVAEQDARRRKAEEFLDLGHTAATTQQRVQALTAAAGLTPDNTDIWLQLAHLGRWTGDYVQTSGYLDSAAAAVRKFPPDYPAEAKKEAQRNTALARAWLHYDRAEYREARRWVRAADLASPGDLRVRRISGLVAGSLNRRSQAHEIAGEMVRNDPGDPDAKWVLAVLDGAQERFREAFNYVEFLRPDHENSSECYRDMGQIAEQLQEWAYASRWYNEAFHSLPLADRSGISGFTYRRLEPDNPGSDQPVWLASDRYFVTGSLSAYCAFAMDRFDDGADLPSRDFWAGQVVDAAGILLRQDFHRAWSLRARGLVFGNMDKPKRALRDLRQASANLRARGMRDARVEAMIGHLLLLEKDHEKALPYLQEAVALDPEGASAWSDLGLCHIMAGQRPAAREALTRAIELKPDLAAAWYNRGLMYLHEGQLDLAESDLQQAARLAPGNTEVVKLLQQVKLRQKSSR